MKKLDILTKIDRCLQVLLLLLIVGLFIWQVRDYQSEDCQEKCYEYCDNISEQVTSINTQLKELELIYED